MADPYAPPARTRPGVVTISTYLLWLFALTQVIGLIISLATYSTTSKVLDDAYRGTDANGMQSFVGLGMAVAIGNAIFMILVAIVLATLGVFNNRGSNGSRITTWVLGGILLCCSGGGLVTSLGGGVGGDQTVGTAPSADEVQRRLEDALPWLTPVTTVLTILGILTLLAALILLALPKANEFFSKPKQTWEPPVPGSSYPGYPQAAGQPQYPGQPGYPQAPDQTDWSAPGGQSPSAPYGGEQGQPGPTPHGEQPGSDRPGPTPPPVS